MLEPSPHVERVDPADGTEVDLRTEGIGEAANEVFFNLEGMNDDDNAGGLRQSEAMQIRRARAEDVSSIVALYLSDPVTGPRETREEPLPEFYHKAFREIEADANEALLVAYDEGVLVGTVQASLIQHVMAQGLRRAVIEAVFVRLDYQGRGIGRMLMLAAINVARNAAAVRWNSPLTRCGTRPMSFIRS